MDVDMHANAVADAKRRPRLQQVLAAIGCDEADGLA